MFKAPTSYPGAGENTQTLLEYTSSSSSSLFLVILRRNMSYFCPPKSEWEITIEKFCDLSKPWGMWWGIQLKNLNAVVPSPVSCHPLPQALKASIIRAPQRAVRQQSPERGRLPQTHNSYTATGKQESCLSGHETQLLQGNGQVAAAFAKPPPCCGQSLSPACHLPAGEEVEGPG